MDDRDLDCSCRYDRVASVREEQNLTGNSREQVEAGDVHSTPLLGTKNKVLSWSTE